MVEVVAAKTTQTQMTFVHHRLQIALKDHSLQSRRCLILCQARIEAGSYTFTKRVLLSILYFFANHPF